MSSNSRVSDTIVDQIEAMILEGTMQAGQRLPTERALAERFKVSRPSVRDALQKLNARGLVNRRQGGGTYVADGVGASFTDPLLNLLNEDSHAAESVIEFRHALEGLAARLAAERGTDEDRQLIQRKYDELKRAQVIGTLEEEAAADAEFHLAIAEAAHNPVLLHVMRTMFLLLRDNIIGNLGRTERASEPRQKIRAQHERMLQHIVLDPNPERARASAREHLETVTEMVRDNLAAKERQITSQRRDLFKP